MCKKSCSSFRLGRSAAETCGLPAKPAVAEPRSTERCRWPRPRGVLYAVPAFLAAAAIGVSAAPASAVPDDDFRLAGSPLEHDNVQTGPRPTIQEFSAGRSDEAAPSGVRQNVGDPAPGDGLRVGAGGRTWAGATTQLGPGNVSVGKLQQSEVRANPDGSSTTERREGSIINSRISLGPLGGVMEHVEGNSIETATVSDNMVNDLEGTFEANKYEGTVGRGFSSQGLAGQVYGGGNFITFNSDSTVDSQHRGPVRTISHSQGKTSTSKFETNGVGGVRAELGGFKAHAQLDAGLSVSNTQIHIVVRDKGATDNDFRTVQTETKQVSLGATARLDVMGSVGRSLVKRSNAEATSGVLPSGNGRMSGSLSYTVSSGTEQVTNEYQDKQLALQHTAATFSGPFREEEALIEVKLDSNGKVAGARGGFSVDGFADSEVQIDRSYVDGELALSRVAATYDGLFRNTETITTIDHRSDTETTESTLKIPFFEPVVTSSKPGLTAGILAIGNAQMDAAVASARDRRGNSRNAVVAFQPTTSPDVGRAAQPPLPVIAEPSTRRSQSPPTRSVVRKVVEPNKPSKPDFGSITPIRRGDILLLKPFRPSWFVAPLATVHPTPAVPARQAVATSATVAIVGPPSESIAFDAASTEGEPVGTAEPTTVNEPVVNIEPVAVEQSVVVVEPLTVEEPLAVEKPVAVPTPVVPAQEKGGPDWPRHRDHSDGQDHGRCLGSALTSNGILHSRQLGADCLCAVPGFCYSRHSFEPKQQGSSLRFEAALQDSPLKIRAEEMVP